MVKPITKETLFMNCMELDFTTKVELEHWMATFEEKVWTEDIMKELSKAGLVRRTVAQVWNKQNHRLTSTFEYEDENAYKAYQAKDFETAREGFTKALHDEPYRTVCSKSPAAVLLARTELYLREGPPVGWIGAHRIKFK